MLVFYRVTELQGDRVTLEIGNWILDIGY